MPEAAPRKCHNPLLMSVHADDSARRKKVHHAVVLRTDAGISEPRLVRRHKTFGLEEKKLSFRRCRLNGPSKGKARFMGSGERGAQRLG